MALTLSLPPELEQRLAAEARRQGMPTDEHALGVADAPLRAASA
jgi:hypothetical protein